MEITEFASEITNRFGTIKRARGCFLYTKKGIRLTDLYQEGGRAILGWGGTSAYTMLKNVLSRGLTGSFDTDFIPQLKKAVSELLGSERIVAVFTEKQDAIKAALKASPQNTSFWRPWNQENIDWRTVDAVVIEPPLAWTPSFFILALKPSAESEAVVISSSQKRLPSPLCAAITRSIYNMIAALQIREEKDWFIYDTVVTKYWTRKGPYLYPKVSEQDYDDFVLHCLDCTLAISPSYNVPSIVPFGADFGVFGKLKNNPFVKK